MLSFPHGRLTAEGLPRCGVRVPRATAGGARELLPSLRKASAAKLDEGTR
jgi:hypothetical protein